MARYGMDYGRDYGGMGRGPRFQGGDRGEWRGHELGGMRSDGGWRNDWRDFPGEEGWYGGRGYDASYRGGMGEMGQMGGYGGDRGSMRGRSQQEFGGEYSRGGGYGGREMGFGEGRGSQNWERYARRGRERSGVRAADLMTEDPETVTPDATLTDVAKKMKEMDVGLIPVVESKDSRKLRGVITDRDIAIRAVGEGKDGKAKVSECMTESVETVNKNDPAHRVLQLMKREQVRRVPVTDREGRLVGIIAQADLAVDFANRSERKEELVSDTIERISQPARQRN